MERNPQHHQHIKATSGTGDTRTFRFKIMFFGVALKSVTDTTPGAINMNGASQWVHVSGIKIKSSTLWLETETRPRLHR